MAKNSVPHLPGWLTACLDGCGGISERVLQADGNDTGPAWEVGMTPGS